MLIIYNIVFCITIHDITFKYSVNILSSYDNQNNNTLTNIVDSSIAGFL